MTVSTLVSRKNSPVILIVFCRAKLCQQNLVGPTVLT